jgi:predicted solute-binding protein
VARDRPEAVAALGAMLRGARTGYAADPEAVVAAAAARFPFSADFIRGYFRRLRYGFGPAERAGLATFLELARESGELRVVPPLAA